MLIPLSGGPLGGYGYGFGVERAGRASKLQMAELWASGLSVVEGLGLNAPSFIHHEALPANLLPERKDFSQRL